MTSEPKNDGPLSKAAAEVYLAQGLYPKAIIIYKLLLKHDPENKEVKKKLEAAEKLLGGSQR